MLLGVLVLVITTMASCNPEGLGLTGFILGVVAAVCLVWLGYKVQCKISRKSPEALLAIMASPSPSAQAIRPEDVCGPWQFYVDIASSTVTVDLQADGLYAQDIVDHRGGRIDCPGGAWTLDGAYLELRLYRSSATQELTEHVRWFFGDWQEGLVLFAKDDPQSEKWLLGQKGRKRRGNKWG